MIMQFLWIIVEHDGWMMEFLWNIAEHDRWMMGFLWTIVEGDGWMMEFLWTIVDGDGWMMTWSSWGSHTPYWVFSSHWVMESVYEGIEAQFPFSLCLRGNSA